ncbi:MAG: transposase [Chroococcidiopsidaceae cyanobacterium CP_BM_RX_35]|nr:transposase [Chroococcidiopsidaceae cyanobacterium CP_BM_RX_35]
MPHSNFSGRSALMPRPVHMVTRLRLDAALYEPATPYHKGQMGRPRLKGKRLPTLNTLLANPQTIWQQVRIEGWYGGTAREVELVSDPAVWYHTGLPAVPNEWVQRVDPQGKFEPQAFLCPDLTVTPVQILVWFRQRWQVEVTFEEAHRHLGMETQSP